MSFYLDTSVITAALTMEATTPRMQSWLGSQPPGDLIVSEWVATEFAAAMSIKQRTGAITPLERTEASKEFSRLWREVFAIAPIGKRHFRAASRFASQYALGLRAGDALHLAIAMDEGAILATLDVKLANAATTLGAGVHMP